jgi:hypothetical protein
MTNKKIILLSLIPPVMVGIYIFLVGLDVPFLDQWAVAALLQKIQQETASLADLFAQHNEHRPFFPRLLWIALAAVTHYNINAQLWLNLLIAVGTFIFFIQRSLKTWERLNLRVSPFIIPFLSLLVFNLGANESWLQGIQTIMFLGIACVVMGLFLLSEASSWASFWGAAILGVISTFSMANGLLFWPVGLLVLLAANEGPSRIRKFLLWVVISALCMGEFFMDWTSQGHLNILYVWNHIPAWIIWMLDFLGSPLMTLWYAAWFFGLLSVALYLLLLRQMWVTKQWQPFIPFLAIALFVLLTGFSISLGRMEMGMEQAVVPRYLTQSAWYWASLTALLPVLDLRKYQYAALHVGLALSLIFLTFAGGWRGYVSLYQRILPAYQAIETGRFPEDEALLLISPNPAEARLLLQFLQQSRLSSYRNRP